MSWGPAASRRCLQLGSDASPACQRAKACAGTAPCLPPAWSRATHSWPEKPSDTKPRRQRTTNHRSCHRHRPGVVADDGSNKTFFFIRIHHIRLELSLKTDADEERSSSAPPTDRTAAFVIPSSVTTFCNVRLSDFFRAREWNGGMPGPRPRTQAGERSRGLAIDGKERQASSPCESAMVVEHRCPCHDQTQSDS